MKDVLDTLLAGVVALHLFGPTIIASVFLSAGGLMLHRPAWLIVGALLSVPFSWYLSGSPNFHFFALSLPVFLLGAALVVHLRVGWVAWLLFLPFIVIFGWLASAPR